MIICVLFTLILGQGNTYCKRYSQDIWVIYTLKKKLFVPYFVRCTLSVHPAFCSRCLTLKCKGQQFTCTKSFNISKKSRKLLRRIWYLIADSQPDLYIWKWTKREARKRIVLIAGRPGKGDKCPTARGNDECRAGKSKRNNS